MAGCIKSDTMAGCIKSDTMAGCIKSDTMAGSDTMASLIVGYKWAIVVCVQGPEDSDIH